MTTTSLRKNPLEILSTLRKKTPVGEQDWILRFDNLEQKKREKKRSCAHVVCVTHRPSIDSESGSSRAESLSKPPCIVLILGAGKKVQDVELREKLDGVTSNDFLNKSIFELCPRSERQVLETLLDAVTQCSAELKLSIHGRPIHVFATSIHQNGEIRLEFKLVERNNHHHTLEPPSNGSMCTFEAISPASSTSRDIPHDISAPSSMCTSVLSSDTYEMKPPYLVPPQNFTSQNITSPQPQLQGNYQGYFQKPSSAASAFDFDPNEDAPPEEVAKKKRRPSKVKVKPDDDEKPMNRFSSSSSSRMTSPLFSPTPEQPKKPTMLQTLLTSNIPCISYNISQSPTVNPPPSYYANHQIVSPSYQVMESPKAPLKKAPAKSRAKKKDTSSTTNQSNTSPTFIQNQQGNSMFQTSMASVPMGGGMSAYVMTGPGPGQGPMGQNGVMFNPHNMPIASTSNSINNLPISQSSSFSIASNPIHQLQNPSMSTSSYGPMNGGQMGGMSQNMVQMGMGVAGNMHNGSMAGPMNGVNVSSQSGPMIAGNPQMMSAASQWAAANGGGPDFSVGNGNGYVNGVMGQQNFVMLQQNAQNGMIGSPNSAMMAQKKNILKRKNLMQPQPGQQFILDQPPSKQPFMGPNQAEMMQNHFMQQQQQQQQNPASMFQMAQQQNGMTNGMSNGVMTGNSPQFSSTSPMNGHSHLSPYGGYDSSNGTQQQWNKRPPSRGDIVRMELRHSVQARRATSPHPPMMSSNDLGMPRFPAPSNISPSNMLMSHQRMGHGQQIPPSMQQSSDAQNQQPSMVNSNGMRYDPVNSGTLMNCIPQNPSFQQTPTNQQNGISPNLSSQQENTNSQPQNQQPPMQFSSTIINTLPTVSLEDCRAILECEFNDLCNDLGPLDFNLCNGQFDMDYDETRTLVQRILS